MPRTHRQRPITYRDHERRVWYVSDVAKLAERELFGA